MRVRQIVWYATFFFCSWVSAGEWEVKTKQAENAFYAKEYCQAILLYESMLVQPGSESSKQIILFNLATAYLLDKQYEKAIETFQKMHLDTSTMPLLKRRYWTNLSVARLRYASEQMEKMMASNSPEESVILRVADELQKGLEDLEQAKESQKEMDVISGLEIEEIAPDLEENREILKELYVEVTQNFYQFLSQSMDIDKRYKEIVVGLASDIDFLSKLHEKAADRATQELYIQYVLEDVEADLKKIDFIELQLSKKWEKAQKEPEKKNLTHTIELLNKIKELLSIAVDALHAQKVWEARTALSSCRILLQVMTQQNQGQALLGSFLDERCRVAAAIVNTQSAAYIHSLLEEFLLLNDIAQEWVKKLQESLESMRREKTTFKQVEQEEVDLGINLYQLLYVSLGKKPTSNEERLSMASSDMMIYRVIDLDELILIRQMIEQLDGLVQKKTEESFQEKMSKIEGMHRQLTQLSDKLQERYKVAILIERKQALENAQIVLKNIQLDLKQQNYLKAKHELEQLMMLFDLPKWMHILFSSYFKQFSDQLENAPVDYLYVLSIANKLEKKLLEMVPYVEKNQEMLLEYNPQKIMQVLGHLKENNHLLIASIEKQGFNHASFFLQADLFFLKYLKQLLQDTSTRIPYYVLKNSVDYQTHVLKMSELTHTISQNRATLDPIPSFLCLVQGEVLSTIEDFLPALDRMGAEWHHNHPETDINAFKEQKPWPDVLKLVEKGKAQIEIAFRSMSQSLVDYPEVIRSETEGLAEWKKALELLEDKKQSSSEEESSSPQGGQDPSGGIHMQPVDGSDEEEEKKGEKSSPQKEVIDLLQQVQKMEKEDQIRPHRKPLIKKGSKPW